MRLLCTLIVFLSLSAIIKSEEFTVRIVSRPDNCRVKSRIGDILHMSYVGKLVDGTIFDSRFVYCKLD